MKAGCSFLLRLGMAMLVHGFYFFVHHLGIYLRRGNITVPHELLQRAQVSTVFQQVHRKAVAQGVGGDVLLDMGFLLIEL